MLYLPFKLQGWEPNFEVWDSVCHLLELIEIINLFKYFASFDI